MLKSLENFSTILSTSPVRILFNRIMKLISPLFLIISVNSAITKFPHKSKLRYPFIDDTFVHIGNPLTGGI